VEYATQLRVLADELGIADGIVWVGGIPLEDTVHFYRSADVLVYPSFNETFGLPLLEAMACGCPVVTSNISAMPETAGAAALLVDPHDPESIANAIVEACGPEEERLRKLGPERAGEFTWAATAERTLDVYREVHSRRPRRGGRR
jgi:glycosyltransferase involved in cell wall biosynthesis